MKQNLLQYYVSLLRTNKDTQVQSEHKKQFVTALHNAIRTMCFSRNNKICEEDFSNLDFGNIPLNGIKFSVDGYLPSSFSGSILHEWNLYSGHTYPVTYANFSGNGKYVITLDEEGKLIVWNVERKIIQDQYSIGTETNQVDGYGFSFNYLFNNYFVTISQNCKFFTTCYKHQYTKVILGLLKPIYMKPVEREIIEIFEISTGKCQHIPEHYNQNFSSSSMVFTHDERYLITCYNDNKATMWNTSDGGFVRDFVGHKKEVTSVGFSEDDTLCITGSEDNTAKIWNVETGKCVQTLHGNDRRNTITAVAISRDKNYFITGDDDGIVKLWTADGKCKYTFDKHNDKIAKLYFTSNCKQCITVSMDCNIRLWSVETGDLIHTTEWRSITTLFSHSTDFFSERNNYIYLYDNGFMIKELESNLVISDFKYHYCMVADVSISCNYFLIGCDKNYPLILFDKNRKEICNYKINKYGILESVDISYDEHFFMAYFRSSNMIIIYNMDTKEIVNTFDKYADIVKVSFVPKHDLIFVLTDDGIGRYLDIETGKCVCLFNGDKYSSLNSSVAFSQDGQYCFCKYSGGMFVLWKLGNKKPIHIFECEDEYDYVEHSFVSVCGKYCAIITKNDLRIWDIQAEELLDNIFWGVSWKKIKMFYFLGDGYYFVIGEDDSQDYDFNQKVKVSASMFETETGDFIKDFQTEDLLSGFIRWQFPYYFCFNDNYVDVYELDCFSSEDEIISNYIGRFYLIDDLNVKGCDFSNIDADDVIKDILSQYNGNL